LKGKNLESIGAKKNGITILENVNVKAKGDKSGSKRED